MSLDWRDTLQTLVGQFEARAKRLPGLHHMMVEVADDERDKMTGPGWFTPFSNDISIVGGKPQFRKWDMTASRGLPGISPGFREPKSGETFEDSQTDGVIRDKCGVVRAVAVPMKLRRGYLCGQPSEEASGFESLANVAAEALAASTNLDQHPFASDLTDIFRKPRGGVRYIFGEVPAVPDRFLASGWRTGYLQFESGVLIDVPISENAPDACHWLLLLHRLGWHRLGGSGLRAERKAWNGGVEVAFEMLGHDWSGFPTQVSEQFAAISPESFYSVLGIKDAPLDVNLASVFAIQLLLEELSTDGRSSENTAETAVDYSNEEWLKRAIPQLRIVTREESDSTIQPQVGLLVATEVERQAALKRMRPPKGRRAVHQVHVGSNTCYLGRLGVTEIMLCMTAMGSSGRDASTIVTTEIIQSWNLRAVIMAGIAFGKDQAKQQIGSVLVSERIISYEPQRIGRDSIESRGSAHVAGPVLLNRFRNVLRWSFKDPNGRECGFQIGPILSGEKLIDKVDFKEELFKRHPTAIGGEMEGTGVAASAERQGCEWIVVKAICDWGDGTKTKRHQSFAAASAVSLVEHVLNQAGVLESLG